MYICFSYVRCRNFHIRPEYTGVSEENIAHQGGSHSLVRYVIAHSVIVEIPGNGQHTINRIFAVIISINYNLVIGGSISVCIRVQYCYEWHWWGVLLWGVWICESGFWSGWNIQHFTKFDVYGSSCLRKIITIFWYRLCSCICTSVTRYGKIGMSILVWHTANFHEGNFICRWHHIICIVRWCRSSVDDVVHLLMMSFICRWCRSSVDDGVHL